MRKRYEWHKCLIDHRGGGSRYDPDHLVADHGNGPGGSRERYRSVDELHDLSDHFRTRTRFRTDWALALVPEREACKGLIGNDRLKHPAALRPGVARYGVIAN